MAPKTAVKTAQPGDVIPLPPLPAPYVPAPSASPQVQCVGAASILAPAAAIASQATVLSELRARRVSLRDIFNQQVVRELTPVLRACQEHPAHYEQIAALLRASDMYALSKAIVCSPSAPGVSAPLSGRVTDPPSAMSTAVGSATAASTTAASSAPAAASSAPAAASPAAPHAVAAALAAVSPHAINHSRLLSLLTAYELGTTELVQREQLQREALMAMQA